VGEGVCVFVGVDVLVGVGELVCVGVWVVVWVGVWVVVCVGVWVVVCVGVWVVVCVGVVVWVGDGVLVVAVFVREVVVPLRTFNRVLPFGLPIPVQASHPEVALYFPPPFPTSLLPDVISWSALGLLYKMGLRKGTF
jgi:hypothetical protein